MSKIVPCKIICSCNHELQKSNFSNLENVHEDQPVIVGWLIKISR